MYVSVENFKPDLTSSSSHSHINTRSIIMRLFTTFFDGICTWMKKKRNGVVVHKKRRSSVTSTVKCLIVDDEVTESYDLNLPATYYDDEEDDALDDSLSTATSILPSSTSTYHKCKVQEALEYDRSLRIQSTLQLHQYW